MENKLLVLNMKMYMDIDDVNNYIKKISNLSNNVILCPESIYIPYFINKYDNIAIQSIYPIDKGAYTGCISAYHAKKMGVNYAIVGHSECRKYFNLTDEYINEQILSAINNNLKVILCIGETLEEKNALKTKEKLKYQLDVDLKGINSNDIIIAYEPIFSIGTGNVPTNDDIYDTIEYVKEILREKGLNSIVIYGGSVNPKNIKNLSSISNVDGFIVGKSSSIPEEVLEMEKLLRS